MHTYTHIQHYISIIVIMIMIIMSTCIYIYICIERERDIMHTYNPHLGLINVPLLMCVLLKTIWFAIQLLSKRPEID